MTQSSNSTKKTSIQKFYQKSQNKLREETDISNIIKSLRRANDQHHSGIIYTDSEEEHKAEELMKVGDPKMRETMDL